ncbi:trypsin-like peptidase domain-containing protein [Pseudonocardia aurantiaca]|uniref:S1C family serine protease n=1 Tax=Pseudonocardia aurantiaca TaxID=75290 RepID=A0ABW4FLP0_9PSEU
MVNDSPEHDDIPKGPAEGVPPAGERSPWAQPVVSARTGPDQRWDERAGFFGPARPGPAHHDAAQHDPAGYSTARLGPPEFAAQAYAPGPQSGHGGSRHTGWMAGSHGPPGGAPGWPGPPDSARQFAFDPRPEPRASRARLLAFGLIAVLLAGVVGGLMGYSLAAGNRGGGSVGVLENPLPAIDAASAPQGPVEAVAARVLPSVVQLRVEGAGSSGEGSAMVLSNDGLLLTNNHVVEPAAGVGRVTAVFQDGSTAPAEIVGRDPSSDLAVLRAQNVSGLAPVELGNSDSVRVGQPVVAFGSPLGLGGTVTTGIISAVDRAVSVGEQQGANAPTVLNALQTDAAINPGNSGGPLVDMEGRVVGINSAIATTGAQGGSIGVGFSIPINQARRVAGELERTGRASRAVLGVTVADDPQRAGALIRTVLPDGAAAQAGIREGDLVLRFGDQRISTGTDLQAAVGSRAPGEVVEIELADRKVNATLTAAPN